MRAVRFDRYGDENVLYIADVPKPDAPPGQVVVHVRSAGVSTGEVHIRDGSMDAISPAHFPEGEGTEFSGVVDSVGADVTGVSLGDEVIGFADIRGAQADFVPVPPSNVLPKPENLDWDVAAATVSGGATATAIMRAISPKSGETIVVAGGTGAVGTVLVQLITRTGARVISTASPDARQAVREWGAEPVDYGDGLEERIHELAPDGVDAFADCVGGGYVDLALKLGVAKERVNTTIDFEAAKRTGVSAEGMYQLDDIKAALVDFVPLVTAGVVRLPIRARYPLEQVQDAYRRLAKKGEVGRVVLDVSTA